MTHATNRFKKTSNERRGYIRVLDAVALDVRKLESDEESSTSGSLQFGKIGSGFEGLEDLREDNPEAAAYIDALESKLGQMTNDKSSITEQAKIPTHKISLSGSGIAFSHDQLLQPGDRVELGLTFFPSNKFAKVVATLVSVGSSAGAVSGGQHAARAVYSKIDPKTHATILEHIDYVLSRM